MWFQSITDFNANSSIQLPEGFWELGGQWWVYTWNVKGNFQITGRCEARHIDAIILKIQGEIFSLRCMNLLGDGTCALKWDDSWKRKNCPIVALENVTWDVDTIKKQVA